MAIEIVSQVVMVVVRVMKIATQVAIAGGGNTSGDGGFEGN